MDDFLASSAPYLYRRIVQAADKRPITTGALCMTWHLQHVDRRVEADDEMRMTRRQSDVDPWHHLTRAEADVV